MDKYEKRTMKKKESIIAAATRLFKENGFKNTSIKQIAAEANVSQVSIYNYYANKDALVKECAIHLMKENTEKVNAYIQSDKSFLETIDFAIENCLSTSHNILFDYFGEQVIDDKKFHDLLKESEKLIRRDMMVSFVEKGKKENILNDSISTESIVDFIIAATQLQSMWSAEEYEEKSKELYALLLYGIMGKTP